jgi:hypothetical protein
VSVVSPRNDKISLRKLYESDWKDIHEEDWSERIDTVTVCCDMCRQGQRRSETRWMMDGKQSSKGPPVTFDSDRMVMVKTNWRNREKFSVLAKFWDQYRPPNFNREFEDWADSQTEVHIP